MPRKRFAKVELDFWLDSGVIRSMPPADRGYYLDIWVRAVRGRESIIDSWQLVFGSTWRCRASRVRSIVARLAALQHHGKPLLTIVSPTALHVSGVYKVHKGQPGRPPLVNPDVDLDVDVDQDGDVDGAAPTGASASKVALTVDVPIPQRGLKATPTRQARRPGGARPTGKAESTTTGMDSPLKARPPEAEAKAPTKTPTKALPTMAEAQARSLSLLAEIDKRKADKATASARMQGTTTTTPTSTDPGPSSFPAHKTNGQGKGLPPDDDIPF